MSGIAGVFNRGGNDVSNDILANMIEAGRYRGPDSRAFRTFGQTGLCQLLMATTPEAVAETHPFMHTASNTSIVFDGRIDNRDELIGNLESYGHVRTTVCDMEIVLLSWLQWRVDCVAHLLGDFAFAIWDGNQRQLFCARDTAGIRPFHYFMHKDVFVFASDICQVLQHPAVVTRANEGMAGEILCTTWINEEETLYKDIFRLRPAHYLLADSRGVEIRQYWNPNESPSIRYSSDAEYGEHFNEIFREAVKSRLRCNGPLGASMSGGFDSTLVVGMAQSLLNEQNGGVMNTFSITQPGHPYDELPRIQAMVDKWGLRGHYLAFDGFKEDQQWDEQARLSRDLPEFPTQSAMKVLQRQAAATGIRVLLSGDGADTWLGGSNYPYLSLLLDGKLPELLRESKYQISSDWRAATRHITRSLLWPVLPHAAKLRLESGSIRGSRDFFLPQAFQDKIGLQQRLHKYDCAHEFTDLAKWSRRFNVLVSGTASYNELEDRANARETIEERSPFTDKRLIEYALGIPDYQNHRQGFRKRLVRQLGKQFWPEGMFEESTKADYFRLLVEAFNLESVRTAFERLEISHLGWVSKSSVLDAYKLVSHRVATGSDFSRHEMSLIAPLITTFAVETWYCQNFVVNHN